MNDDEMDGLCNTKAPDTESTISREWPRGRISCEWKSHNQLDFRKWNMNKWNGFNWRRAASNDEICEVGNEISGFVKVKLI